jgi:hypothetical protein
MWMQLQAINNSTFENEHDIGKAAISDWTINYNKKHVGKMSINSLHEESIFMFTWLLTEPYFKTTLYKDNSDFIDFNFGNNNPYHLWTVFEELLHLEDFLFLRRFNENGDPLSEQKNPNHIVNYKICIDNTTV